MITEACRSARLGWAVAACVVLSAAGTPAAAQDPVFLYAVNEPGLLSVGGTTLEKLTGKFKPNNVSEPMGWQRWVDIAIVGADRWSLRLDGRIERNGEKLVKLNFSIYPGAPLWSRLDVSSGTVRALRSDGLFYTDDGVAGPASNNELDVIEDDKSYFTDFVVTSSGVFLVRADGYLFRQGELMPVARFQGGEGNNPNDGKSPKHSWVRLQQDPSGDLVALRGDGKVYGIAPPTGSAPLDPPLAEPIVELPFHGRHYVDREPFGDDGWVALTEDGRIFEPIIVPPGVEPPEDTGTELVNFPGTGESESHTFVDLLSSGAGVWALRFDGRVYYLADPAPAPDAAPTDPVLDLDKGRYARLAVSDQSPNLEAFDNHAPVLSVYKPRLVEGQSDFLVPTLVTDVDQALEDLVVGFDLSGLRCPPGTDPCGTLTVGEVPRRVQLPADLLPGSHSFLISADDSIAKAKAYRFPVKVVPADDNPGKNWPPMPSKIKRIQALVGTELIVPLLAADRDGDVVTITAVDGKGIFDGDQGATLVDGVLHWTPGIEHVGKTVAKFSASDGTATRRFSIKITVVSPLIFTGTVP